MTVQTDIKASIKTAMNLAYGEAEAVYDTFGGVIGDGIGDNLGNYIGGHASEAGPPLNGEVPVWNAGAAEWQFAVVAGAVHNHDGRYYTETELDGGQLDNRYYTEGELDGGQLDNRYYTEAELNAGQLDNRYYTEVELDAGQLDNRYFRENEFLNASAGAGDAGKPVILDAGGHIDATMINDGDVTHDSLAGLPGGDTHTQYSLVTGTRSFTGRVMIDGSADVPQLVVQANAVQDNANPLILFEASDGTDIMAIHSDDPSNIYMGIGAGALNVVAGADGVNNLFFGSGAGATNASGSGSVAIGSNALASSDVDDTIAIGLNSLTSLTNGRFNVALGTGSLATATVAEKNIAIGYEASSLMLDADFTIAIGYQALKNNLGQNNVAIGSQSMLNCTIGTGSVGIGPLSLYNCTEGTLNMAIANGALYNVTTGDKHVAIGVSSGFSVTTANSTINIGYLAGYSNTQNYTMSIGTEALRYNVGGQANCGIGYLSLRYTVNGHFNTSIGYTAGRGVSTKSIFSNTLIGYRCGYSLTTNGDENTIIGTGAGDVVSSGAGNLILGYQMADNLTTGDGGIYIGYNLDASAPGVDDELNIGGVITGAMGTPALDFCSGTMVIEGDTGDVGIGVGNPGYRLVVQDDVNGYVASFFNDGSDKNRKGIRIRSGDDAGTGVGDTNIYIRFSEGDDDATGYIQETNGTLEMVQASDERLKKNIVATKTNALDIVNGFELKDFDFQRSTKVIPKTCEFIAQQCREVFPNMVHEDEEDPEKLLFISKTAVIPVLVKAVQESYAMIQELTARVAQLEIA